ncbi:MAG TPA: hypothetical protein VFT00_04670 [Nocardioides sp.]|nr:hypothetical protein [Nocardioides sp.]
MSDPFDELRRLSEQGLDVNPIPASEVRRRGDRLRRRNHALAAVAGVAAIALIAVPLSLVANGNDRSAPDPANHSSGTPTTAIDNNWLQAIPSGFDLTALPSDATFAYEARMHTVVDDLTFCGDLTFSTRQRDAAGSVVDTAGADYAEPGTESSSARSLVLYDDDAAAQSALERIRSKVLACPTNIGPGDQEVRWAPAEVTLAADDAFVFTEQVPMGGGLLADLSVIQVARVGNALYLSSLHTSAGGQQVVDTEVPRAAHFSAPVLSDMCVFAADPCGTPPSASSSEGTGEGAVSAIPADFPLLDGYPSDDQSEGGDNGRKGPSTTLEPLVPEACGSSVPVPEHVELLRAGWKNPEDFRERQLVTFARTEDALAYQDAILETYTRCTTEDTSDGYTSVTTVLDSEIGESSGVAVTHYELDGNPAIGLTTVHVVQVGRAVLVSTIHNEGGGGPDPTRQAYDAMAGSEDQLAGVVPAMCVFTDDGC